MTTFTIKIDRIALHRSITTNRIVGAAEGYECEAREAPCVYGAEELLMRIG